MDATIWDPLVSTCGVPVPAMDSRVVPAPDVLARFGQAVRIWQNQPPRTKPTAEKLCATIMAAAAEADRRGALLMNNREVVEELMK